MEEAPISVTRKDRKGDLHTIRADRPDQLRSVCEFLGVDLDSVKAGFQEAFNGAVTDRAVAAVQQAAPASRVIQDTVVDPWTGEVTSVAPAQPASQPATAPAGAAPATGPQCPHGTMTWREGHNDKTNRDWKGWFCPSPKGTVDQCKPRFER